MKTLAVIEKNKDGKFSIYVPGVECASINGQGDTVAAAIDDLKEALNEVVETYDELEGAVPDELKGLEFEYKYDVPSLFDFFTEINISAFARRVGINDSLMRQYKNGLAFASEKQIAKIRQGLHELGRQLFSANI